LVTVLEKASSIVRIHIGIQSRVEVTTRWEYNLRTGSAARTGESERERGPRLRLFSMHLEHSLERGPPPAPCTLPALAAPAPSSTGHNSGSHAPLNQATHVRKPASTFRLPPVPAPEPVGLSPKVSMPELPKRTLSGACKALHSCSCSTRH